MLTFGQRTFKLITQAIRNLDFAVGFKGKEHREMNCKFGVLFADGRLAVVLMMAVTFLAMVSSSHAFQEDIIGAWPMDEGVGKTVGDFMGNHSDSEIIGDAEWVEGRFGKALRFDGSGGHVLISFDPKFAVLNQDDFTFALWFKAEALPGDRGTWIAGFQQTDANGTGRTWMGLQDGTDLVYSALGNIRPVGAMPEADKWCHFTLVVYEDGAGDTLQLYSDGVLQTEEPLSVEDCEGDYLIGCHKNLNAVNSWEGVLDEVVIIRKALTETEVNQLMNDGVVHALAVDGRGKLATNWGYLKSHN